MPRSRSTVTAIAMVALAAATAFADPDPGPAVTAPATTDAGATSAATAPTTPGLPPPESPHKRVKMLELDGYFRLRTEWDKDFWLGFNQQLGGGAPWPQPPSCSSNGLNHPCDDSTRTADMRLRLEPTMNLSEGTSIHIQADALDNVVLGSTPEGLDLGGIYTGVASATGANRPPLAPFLNDNQAAPTQGVNSNEPSLLVKRAWAEVALPFGVLKVGRQPNQWGMGVWKNAGGYDPVTGTYDYLADYGDSVDRISFTAPIPGTPLRAMLAYDFADSGLTSNMTPADTAYAEHPIDLDASSNVNTIVGVVSKMESPQEFKERVDRGETMFDYGVYSEYKTQSWDENLTNFTLGTNPNSAADVFDSATSYVPRHYRSFAASLWGKLAWGDFVAESELVGVVGHIDDLGDYQHVNDVSIRQFGGVGRLTWSHFDNKLHLGFESGFATGGETTNTPAGDTNIAYASLLGSPTTTQLTQFMFNQEYKIDLIFWHQLVGAVTNAVYARPFVAYDLTKSITAKLWNVTSAAVKPSATPGDSRWYGTEFDADLSYHASNGIMAGLAGGVLFPFSAESHPTGSTYDATNQGPAQDAYTIMARVILAF
jgi:uncharacterized protein (TIGR04551 family)